MLDRIDLHVLSLLCREALDLILGILGKVFIVALPDEDPSPSLVRLPDGIGRSRKDSLSEVTISGALHKVKRKDQNTCDTFIFRIEIQIQHEQQVWYKVAFRSCYAFVCQTDQGTGWEQVWADVCYGTEVATEIQNMTRASHLNHSAHSALMPYHHCRVRNLKKGLNIRILPAHSLSMLMVHFDKSKSMSQFVNLTRSTCNRKSMDCLNKQMSMDFSGCTKSCNQNNYVPGGEWACASTDLSSHVLCIYFQGNTNMK